MSPTEQERERLQDLLSVQHQQWQDINARMSQNFSNRLLYARLEMELKQTEREIVRLELMLEDPNAFEPTTPSRDEEIVVPAPKLVRKKRRPASPVAVASVLGGLTVILLAAAIWIFLLRTPTTDTFNPSLPGATQSRPNIQERLANGNFAADLSGWSARLNDTTRTAFRTQATADSRQYRALNLEHAGRGAGTVGQAVRLTNQAVKFSVLASGRADETAGKQGNAYLLVQYLDRNGQALGGTVFSAWSNLPAFADSRRYRVQPLTGVLTEYNLDIQNELSRLPAIDPTQVNALNILIYAGAVNESAQCQPTECKAEIAVAEIRIE